MRVFKKDQKEKSLEKSHKIIGPEKLKLLCKRSLVRQIRDFSKDGITFLRRCEYMRKLLKSSKRNIKEKYKKNSQKLQSCNYEISYN